MKSNHRKSLEPLSDNTLMAVVRDTPNTIQYSATYVRVYLKERLRTAKLILIERGVNF